MIDLEKEKNDGKKLSQEIEKLKKENQELKVHNKCLEGYAELMKWQKI